MSQTYPVANLLRTDSTNIDLTITDLSG